MLIENFLTASVQPSSAVFFNHFPVISCQKIILPVSSPFFSNKFDENLVSNDDDDDFDDDEDDDDKITSDSCCNK